jgi:hypothetical protein
LGELGNWDARLKVQDPSDSVDGVQENKPVADSMVAETSEQVFASPYGDVAPSQEKVAPPTGWRGPTEGMSENTWAVNSTGVPSVTDTEAGALRVDAADLAYAVKVTAEPDFILSRSSPASSVTTQRSAEEDVLPVIVTEDGVRLVTISPPGAEHGFVTKILGDVPAAPMNLITEQVVEPTSPVVEAKTDRLSHDTIAELGAERAGCEDNELKAKRNRDIVCLITGGPP